MFGAGPAVAIYGPAAAGSGDRCAPQAQVITAGNAGTLITLAGPAEAFVTITCDNDCYVRVGQDDTLVAGSVLDFPLWSKSYLQWVVGNYRYMRVFAGASDVAFWAYLSSR